MRLTVHGDGRLRGDAGWRCTLTLMFAAAVLTAASVQADARAAARPACNARFGPEPIDTAVIVKRRHVSCRTAKRIVIRFMHEEEGAGIPRNVGGWRCRWYPPGEPPGPTCRRRHRLIKFETD